MATQWIQSYPCKTKTSLETEESFQKFLEPTWKPKAIYTDNSMEFGKACEDLSWNHCTSTLHRSKTIGVAERAVRRIKEGTSAVLLQSGLDEKWWADSMECYCYLRNIQDLLFDGQTPHERRFGKPFKGPIIPFGSMIEDDPISAKDLSRLHHFGKKVSPGIFIGYVLYAWRIWRRRHFGRRHWGFGKMGRIVKSTLRWKSETVWRRSGSENVHLDTGQPWTRRRAGRSSRRIRRVSTTRLTAGWWWSKKWFLVHFRELHLPSSRWTRESNYTCRWKSHSNSTTIYWRGQNYKYDLGCDAWTPHRRPLECRDGTEIYQMRGQVSHDSLCWMKNLQTGIHGLGSGWQRSKQHPGQDHLLPENMEKYVRRSSTQRNKSGLSKHHAR